MRKKLFTSETHDMSDNNDIMDEQNRKQWFQPAFSR